MNLERVWTDLYGCPRAVWSGTPGGHSWLLISSAQFVSTVSSVIEKVSCKGTFFLIVTENVTPLMFAVRELEPYGALIIGDKTLCGGPTCQIDPFLTECGGVAYQEGGSFPAWKSVLDLDAEVGQSTVASALFELGVPVIHTAVQDFEQVLSLWLAQTPYSLVHAS